MKFFKIKLSLLMFFLVIQVRAQEHLINQTSGNYNGTSTTGHASAIHSKECDSSLSTRLDGFKKWLMTLDKSDTEITKDIEDRRETMTDTTLFQIDTTGVIFEGSHSAPISIIAYISITCPLCKRLYKELYDSIKSGSLAKIARIGIKPFPENQMNVALVAAGRWHKQAALIKALAPVKDRITMEIITRIMDSLKVPQNEFANACKDQALVSYVQRSYSEGKKNSVSFTPTFFINKHRYRSCKDTRWVADAIEYRNQCDQSTKHKVRIDSLKHPKK